jgi:hypothetical protein
MTDYAAWSYVHSAWLLPNDRGYTMDISKAAAWTGEYIDYTKYNGVAYVNLDEVHKALWLLIDIIKDGVSSYEEAAVVLCRKWSECYTGGMRTISYLIIRELARERLGEQGATSMDNYVDLQEKEKKFIAARQKYNDAMVSNDLARINKDKTWQKISGLQKELEACFDKMLGYKGLATAIKQYKYLENCAHIVRLCKEIEQIDVEKDKIENIFYEECKEKIRMVYDEYVDAKREYDEAYKEYAKYIKGKL